jgi:hypothetical protein
MPCVCCAVAAATAAAVSMQLCRNVTQLCMRTVDLACLEKKSVDVSELAMSKSHAAAELFQLPPIPVENGAL